MTNEKQRFGQSEAVFPYGFAPILPTQPVATLIAPSKRVSLSRPAAPAMSGRPIGR